MVTRWGKVDDDKMLSGSVRAARDALVQELPDGEAVFLNLETEEYFGVDAVGARMWHALIAGGSVEAACATLLDEFDVAPERLRSDLDAFVRQLLDRGLVELSHE